MNVVHTRAKFDWLAELGGASVVSLAAGFAALKLAPSLALPMHAATAGAGLGLFAVGLVLMRAVKTPPRQLRLSEFVVQPIDLGELLLDRRYEEPLLLEDLADDQPLLLEDVAEEPLLLEDIAEDEPLLIENVVDDGALLLEDMLPSASPDSRVVQLFASLPLPTAGELKQRIDCHLAASQPRMPQPQPDASPALYAALDDLRRALR